jgi:hypothetical protein
MYKTTAVLLLLGTGIMIGCAKKRDAESDDAAKHSAVGAKYLVEQEPADAKPVGEAIQGEDEAEVTLVGRIGGADKPLEEGLAAFTIVDLSLKACSDIPGDNCEKPWDYCCEPRESLRANSVAVKFTDEKGSVVPIDADKLFGVEPLSTVVVQGKLRKDEAGNTSVVGKKMYVRK